MGILDAVSNKTQVKKVASTKGGEYAGPCPICGGSDRFRVWPADKGGEGSWWCRGCGKGGDLVQWHVDFEGMAYKDAFRAAGRAPLTPDSGYVSKRQQRLQAVSTLPVADKKPDFIPRRHESPIETWQIKARELVDASHARLLETPKVLGWLHARGLDLDAVKAFSLGWFPGERDNPCMWRPRLSWGLPEVLNNSGKPKKLWIPRGVVIPWIVNGEIKRIKIRRPKADLGDKGVKYYLIPGSVSEAALFNPDRKAFVVLESELDAMLIAAKAGGLVGSVALGSAGNKPGAYSWDRLRHALRVLVALDNDDAGDKAYAWWSEHFDNAKRWPVSVGKDPGEAFAQGVDIRQWVMEGLPPVMTLNLKHKPGASDQNSLADASVATTPSGAALPKASSESLLTDATNDPIPSAIQPDPAESETAQGADDAVGGNDDWLPQAIIDLREIIQRYPVKIICTEGRLAIVNHPDFRNEPVLNRLSDLVFWDPNVGAFLDSFPKNEIHRGNFAEGL